MSSNRDRLKTLLEGLDRLEQLSRPHPALGIRWNEKTSTDERDHVAVCMEAMEGIQRLAGQQRACRSMAELIANHLQRQSTSSDERQYVTTRPTASENKE